MQKLVNVTFTTPTQITFAKEALDIGANYYFISDNKVNVVKKDGSVKISFDNIIQDNDNSQYINKKEVVFA